MLRNDKLVVVIDGYQILPSTEKGCVFIRSPKGVNFTVHVSLLYKLLYLIDNDVSFREKLNLK